jgi:hypothetical protein
LLIVASVVTVTFLLLIARHKTTKGFARLPKSVGGLPNGATSSVLHQLSGLVSHAIHRISDTVNRFANLIDST